jgi:hypothetical protein
MKLTKANLQKIIQEEIENLIREEDEEELTDLQKAVIAAKPDGAPMSAQADRLPRWLDIKLKDLMKDYREDLTDEKGEPLKGPALKNALGIGTEESEYEKRMRIMNQRDES